MYGKTDSEATSLAPSSPDHNRQPAYFVQSPSHDGEKTTMSFESTPAVGSPMGSPVHSRSHSRESSTSRFSGSLKPTGSRKVSPNDNDGREEHGNNGNNNNKWKGKGREKEWCDVIEEEGQGLLEAGEESRKGWPLRCYVLAFVVGFFLLFSLFALILWGASKPQKPRIAIKSMKFQTFTIQAGSDDTGVSTEMISVNATVKFTFRNTAKFFGVHVSSTPITISHSELNIGFGSMKKFYQSRNGAKNVTVIVIGDKIPMYGSGVGLSTPTGMTTLPVPLKLEFTVRSRAYVLGKLVKPRFNKKIECPLVFQLKKLNVAIPLKNNCTLTDE